MSIQGGQTPSQECLLALRACRVVCLWEVSDRGPQAVHTLRNFPFDRLVSSCQRIELCLPDRSLLAQFLGLCRDRLGHRIVIDEQHSAGGTPNRSVDLCDATSRRLGLFRRVVILCCATSAQCSDDLRLQVSLTIDVLKSSHYKSLKCIRRHVHPVFEQPAGDAATARVVSVVHGLAVHSLPGERNAPHRIAALAEDKSAEGVY